MAFARTARTMTAWLSLLALVLNIVEAGDINILNGPESVVLASEVEWDVSAALPDGKSLTDFSKGYCQWGTGQTYRATTQGADPGSFKLKCWAPSNPTAGALDGQMWPNTNVTLTLCQARESAGEEEDNNHLFDAPQEVPAPACANVSIHTDPVTLSIAESWTPVDTTVLKAGGAIKASYFKAAETDSTTDVTALFTEMVGGQTQEVNGTYACKQKVVQAFSECEVTFHMPPPLNGTENTFWVNFTLPGTGFVPPLTQVLRRTTFRITDVVPRQSAPSPATYFVKGFIGTPEELQKSRMTSSFSHSLGTGDCTPMTIDTEALANRALGDAGDLPWTSQCGFPNFKVPVPVEGSDIMIFHTVQWDQTKYPTVSFTRQVSYKLMPLYPDRHGALTEDAIDLNANSYAQFSGNGTVAIGEDVQAVLSYQNQTWDLHATLTQTDQTNSWDAEVILPYLRDDGVYTLNFTLGPIGQHRYNRIELSNPVNITAGLVTDFRNVTPDATDVHDIITVHGFGLSALSDPSLVGMCLFEDNALASEPTPLIPAGEYEWVFFCIPPFTEDPLPCCLGPSNITALIFDPQTNSTLGTPFVKDHEWVRTMPPVLASNVTEPPSACTAQNVSVVGGPFCNADPLAPGFPACLWDEIVEYPAIASNDHAMARCAVIGWDSTTPYRHTLRIRTEENVKSDLVSFLYDDWRLLSVSPHQTETLGDIPITVTLARTTPLDPDGKVSCVWTNDDEGEFHTSSAVISSDLPMTATCDAPRHYPAEGVKLHLRFEVDTPPSSHDLWVDLMDGSPPESLAFTYIHANRPALSNAVPPVVSFKGGEVVTVTGQGFNDVADYVPDHVFCGWFPADDADQSHAITTPAEKTDLTATSLKCVSPEHEEGPIDLRISIDNKGQWSAPLRLEYKGGEIPAKGGSHLGFWLFLLVTVGAGAFYMSKRPRDVNGNRPVWDTSESRGMFSRLFPSRQDNRSGYQELDSL